MKNKLKLSVRYLRSTKNLLAFSAGVDSSALFYLLLREGIRFDIAIVDYGVRDQSAEEVAYARSIARKHGMECFTARAPRFESDFEKNARDYRYRFFESLIERYQYTHLLTAHQLNDRLEWMLMRLAKGAGLGELAGMQSIQEMDGYVLVRPLLEYAKQDLAEYLHANGYHYFVDESNSDERYERNYFRKYFANPMIDRYKDGIVRSFTYLERDRSILRSGYEEVYRGEEIRVIRLDSQSLKSYAADQALKQLGYLPSAAQREQISKSESVVIGGEWAVEQSGEMVYIAPYIRAKMPKWFKEQCRNLRIPPKVRPYLYTKKIDIYDLPYRID